MTSCYTSAHRCIRTSISCSFVVVFTNSSFKGFTQHVHKLIVDINRGNWTKALKYCKLFFLHAFSLFVGGKKPSSVTIYWKYQVYGKFPQWTLLTFITVPSPCHLANVISVFLAKLSLCKHWECKNIEERGDKVEKPPSADTKYNQMK